MPSFKLEHEIVNNSTAYDLVVAHKGGLKYIIRKKEEVSYDTEQYLMVRIRSIVLKQLHLDPSKAVTRIDREIVEALLAEMNRLTSGEATFYPQLEDNLTIKIKIGSNQADENNAIHSELLGLTMYSGKGNLNKDALYVPTSTLTEAIQVLQKSNPTRAIHYCAYVVDPRYTQNPFYVNICGKATEVPVSQDDGKNVGLYIGISVGDQPPLTIYHPFDSLTKDKLEGLGVYLSKAEAAKNGNTERYQEAEAKVADLSKALDGKIKQLRDITTRLETAEKNVEGMSTQIGQMKHSHQIELARLAAERRSSEDKQARSEYDTRKELQRIKAELNRKTEISKHTIEQMKQRNKWSLALDALKAIAGLVPLLTFGMRFFTA